MPPIFRHMIYLHTALPAEARALIDRYRLRAVHTDAPFRLYAGERARLVVSGVGKIATAAAVAYAQARFADEKADEKGPWLNIGIAGHAQAAIGSAFVAHKIVDITTGKTFYPFFGRETSCRSTCIYSVDQPTEDYAEDGAFDMEASAFVATAQRFVPAELAHSFKVVSDNPQSSWRNIKRGQVQEWIGQHLSTIDALIELLVKQSAQWHEQRACPPHFNSSLERWHFTVSQQYRLRRLLQQWHALSPEKSPWQDDAQLLKKASCALDYLAQRIADPALAPF